MRETVAMRLVMLAAVAAVAAVFAGRATATRSPAPVSAVWLDRALMHREMVSNDGRDLGIPWMVDCEGIGSDHAADNDTLFFHFRCLISLHKNRYLQDYRTWRAGADVAWTHDGPLWRLVPAHAAAP